IPDVQRGTQSRRGRALCIAHGAQAWGGLTGPLFMSRFFLLETVMRIIGVARLHQMPADSLSSEHTNPSLLRGGRRPPCYLQATLLRVQTVEETPSIHLRLERP